jgi:PPOX class probable F420-dependent enzyme
MKEISAGFAQLMKEPAFCTMATVRPDGSPAIYQLWVDTDGKHVLINTRQKSRKVENLQRDPRVAVNIVDPKNQWRLGSVRGRVVNITTEGADEHIDSLNQKYRGEPVYPWKDPNNPRVILTIEPDWVREVGLDGEQ